MNPRQSSVQEAFDRHSKSCDAQFSHVAIGEEVRAEVWELADAAFASSEHILDLGSGTGEDTLHFAQRGLRVTAVDNSSGMMERLISKARSASLSGRIDTVASEMNRYRPTDVKFDGLLSNFGAINYVADLAWLRELAEVALKPGSRLVLTTMGSFYPLELIVFLLKLQPARAFRRLRRPVDVMVEGSSIRVHYHSLKDLRRELGPKFHLEQVRGLRSFLPAPGWEHLQRFWLVQRLRPLDRFLGHFRMTATCADQFVSVWRYQP